MAEGNRKDPRARVLNMTVRYKSATVDEFIENHSHDISRGGIFIKTRSPFPAGTLLKFEVRIAEDQKLMHGVGRVVWRREADRAEESFPAGMGIKFIKTGEGAAELINQLILAREGAESSFDAGVREAVSAPSARPSVVPPAAAVAAAAPSSAGPPSGPALSVESGPRSLPTEGGTAVTNPAKKRQDLSPEKRKVVLQGPALESPPSNPKPLITPAARGDERAPSRERPARGSIAEETTSPRARPTSVKKEKDNQSPRLSGLLVILGLIALIVFVVNRLRGSAAEPELEPTPAVAAEPTPQQPLPVPATPVEAARPDEPTAAPVDPTAPAAADLGAAEEPGAAGAGAAAAAAAPTAPSAADPRATDPSAAGAAGAAEAAPPSAAPTAPAPSPAPPPTPPAAAAPAPAAPAPTPAPPPQAVAPAPAKPPPPKPAPTPPRAAPKPQPTPPPAAPPADSAEPAPAPAPAPPTTGTAGDSSGATPPAKKPPAPSAEPTPPAPPAPPPSDDNPY